MMSSATEEDEVAAAPPPKKLRATTDNSTTKNDVAASTSRRVTVMIPKDSTAEEGDVLTFEVDGREILLEVPAGAKPGDALEIFLGETRGEADGSGADMEEEVTEITLKSVHGGTVSIVLDTSNLEDVVDEDNDDSGEDDGTQTMAWPSGILLARYLTASCPHIVRGKSVLELGSGLGTCGLAAAVAGAKSVNLTDRPAAMSLLNRSVEQNLETVMGDGNKNDTGCREVLTQALAWGVVEEAYDTATTYDVVLGSDLLYNPDPACLKALAETVAACTAVDGTVLLAVRWRKPELERGFFRTMEGSYGFDFEPVKCAADLSLPCTLGWKEYGNPDCAASNDYFSSSAVGVAALAGDTSTTKIPLGSVTERHQELLSDREYEVFEAMQTQIYRGSRTINK